MNNSLLSSLHYAEVGGSRPT